MNNLYKKFWLKWLTIALLIFAIFGSILIISIWRIGDRLENATCRVVRDGNSYIIFNTDIVVILTAERREHIEQRHPEVDLTDIHTALLWGDMEEDGCFRYYYGNSIKVVVKMINEGKGKIITAYYNSKDR